MGLSKFVKKYVQLNRVIEKAIKKYTKDVKLKKFQLIKFLLMSDSFENKIDLKDKLTSYLRENRRKVILIIMLYFCRFS